MIFVAYAIAIIGAALLSFIFPTYLFLPSGEDPLLLFPWGWVGNSLAAPLAGVVPTCNPRSKKSFITSDDIRITRFIP